MHTIWQPCSPEDNLEKNMTGLVTAMTLVILSRDMKLIGQGLITAPCIGLHLCIYQSPIRLSTICVVLGKAIAWQSNISTILWNLLTQLSSVYDEIKNKVQQAYVKFPPPQGDTTQEISLSLFQYKPYCVEAFWLHLKMYALILH